VQNNNGPNYGSGTVGLVPPGTGIIVLSNDASIIRDNQISGNESLGLALGRPAGAPRRAPTRV
jgi:hypothetical protein